MTILQTSPTFLEAYGEKVKRQRIHEYMNT